MHRTEADGTATIGGLPDQHQNQNLPGTVGSTVSAEFMNALQEELVNIVEYAGLTIKASGAADRSAGFDQAKTAIFESAAIDTSALKDDAVTDAKISDVSLDKLITGDCVIKDLIGGDPDVFKQLAINTTEISIDYQDNSGGTDLRDIISITKSRFKVEHQEDFEAKTTAILTDEELTLYEMASATVTVDVTLDTAQCLLLKTNSDTGVNEKAQMSLNSGFIHEQTVTDAKYGKLSYDGLAFLDSLKNIKFEVIDFSGSWVDEGGGNYSKQLVSSSIPTGAIPLTAQFSYYSESGGFASFVSSDANTLVTVVEHSPYQRVKVFSYGWNPGSADFTNKFVTVWWSES